MIVKMSKYAFMVYHREYDAFLTTLRELGVVHVKETNSVLDNAELQALLAERKQVSTAIRYCKNLNSQTKEVTVAPARGLTKAEGLKLVGKLEEMQEKQAQLQAAKVSLEKDIAYMDIWGEFSYANIRRLKKAGFDVTFFSCPTSKYEPKWGEEYNAFLVNNFQSVTYFVTVTKTGTPIDIDAERPKMPDRGLAKLHLAMEQLLDNIKVLNNQLKEYAAEQYNTLVELEKNIQNEFNLSNTLVQTDREAGDKLMLLEGFVPTEEAPAMEVALEKEGYYFQELDIQDGDRVPIKLKNNKFNRLYEPTFPFFFHLSSRDVLLAELHRVRPDTSFCSLFHALLRTVLRRRRIWFVSVIGLLVFQAESQSGLQTLSYLVPVFGLGGDNRRYVYGFFLWDCIGRCPGIIESERLLCKQ